MCVCKIYTKLLVAFAFLKRYCVYQLIHVTHCNCNTLKFVDFSKNAITGTGAMQVVSAFNMLSAQKKTLALDSIEL